MRARGVVRISPADTGARVTVRSLLPEPGDGPTMTDTVGILESWTDGVLRIRRKNGELVTLTETSVVAARTISAAFPPSGEEKE